MVSTIRVALLPLAVTLVSSTITYLSGLITAYPAYAIVINVAVLGLTYADRYLTALEGEAAATFTVKTVSVKGATSITTGVPAAAISPSPSPRPVNATITYEINGQSISVTPNSPIGTSEQVGNATFNVGQQTVAPFTTPSGCKVPVGAFYIGQGQFELNGEFYS